MLLPVKDCAARLGVHPSNVSRYVAKHGIASAREGKERKVDWAQLERHWRANYQRQVMSGGETRAPNASSEIADARAAAASSPCAAAAYPSEPEREGRAPPTSAPAAELDPARREKSAKAELAELTLAERRAALVSAAEVEAMMADAVGALVEALQIEIPVAADQLLGELRLGDERGPAVRAAMKAMADAARQRFADALGDAAAELAGEREGEAARPRFSALVERALALRASEAPSQ